MHPPFIYIDITSALDTNLTREELGSLEIYLAVLLPIVKKYREERRETAAVYCFLLNRWQFLTDAENDLANARLSETRYISLLGRIGPNRRVVWMYCLTLLPFLPFCATMRIGPLHANLSQQSTFVVMLSSNSSFAEHQKTNRCSIAGY